MTKRGQHDIFDIENDTLDEMLARRVPEPKPDDLLDDFLRRAHRHRSKREAGDRHDPD